MPIWHATTLRHRLPVPSPVPTLLHHRFAPPSDPAALGPAWCEQIAPMFRAELTRPPAAGRIGLSTFHLGDLIVGEMAAPAQRLERTDPMIARQGLDHVLMQFHESGTSRVETARHRGSVAAGQVVLFDLAQPVVVEADPVSATTLLMPRVLVADGIGPIEPLHGRAFAYEGDPVKQLLHTYLRGLIACGAQLAPHQLSGVSQAASKLCGAGFRPEAGAADPVEIGTHVAIRQFIQRELHSADLGVEALTARFGLSRSTLYRLFEAEGGVAHYIRDRRLMQALRLLTEAGSRRRVSQVAYATGFSDEKTFSRAFRRRFGMLPREARAAAPAAPPPPGDASVLHGWIRSLAA